MAKKRHFSARGREVNFDELFIRNQKITAVTGGGAAMNARGDRLGAGGKVVETIEERQKRSDPQQAQSDAAYNTNNPKAVKMVSLKKNIDDLTASTKTSSVEEDEFKQAKTPQQVMQELNKQLDAVKAPKTVKQLDSDASDVDVMDEIADEIKEASKKSSTRKIVDTDE